MSDRNGDNGKPRNYAAEKRSMLTRRIGNGTFMAALRRAGAVIFPGVPVAALVGFTSFSTSPTENTTEAVATQRFHEIGLFQVEAGLRTGPAPNPDRTAEYNTYGKVANTALVKQALGQPPDGPGANMTPNAWKQERYWPDQIACGLAGILRHVNSVRLDSRIAARDSTSNWYWLVAMTAFSRGDGQCAAVMNAYADELALVPEAMRWQAFRTAVARDIVAGTGPSIGRRKGKQGAAYAIVRSEQKFESGAIVADSGEAAWFRSRYTDSTSDRSVEEVIARTAYSESISSMASEAVAEAGNAFKVVADQLKSNAMQTGIGAAVVCLGVAIYFWHRSNVWY